MTKDNPKGRGQSRAGGKTTGAAGSPAVNPTANTSLTPPGPAPKSMESRRSGRGAVDAGSQFGQENRSGQGADLTEQMDAAGPDTGGGSSEPDLIPWDPTGKIDDEVERRTRQPTAGSGGGVTGPSAGGGAPSTGGPSGRSGGGQSGGRGVTGRGGQAPADTGYGGGAETLSANRYADATDNAPTDPEEGATTPLASLAAEDQDATGSAAGSLRKGAAPRKGQPTAPRKAPPGSTEVH